MSWPVGASSVAAFPGPQYGIDVTRRGVIADGSTDDQPALQALIDEVATNRQWPLILPPNRTIQLGAPLTLKSDTAIIGGNLNRGFGYTALRPSGDFPAIQCTSDAIRVYVGQLSILANNLVGGTAYAIDLDSLFMSELERIFVTATDATRTFRGMRLAGVDSLRCNALQITECRGRHLYIESGADSVFTNCNFEADTGVAAEDSSIESAALRISFNGCQFERVGGLIVNARDISFRQVQRTQTTFVFGRRSKNCKLDAGGDQDSAPIYDYGVDNEISGSGQNVHGTRIWPVLRGSVGDGFVSSTKTAQRSVYGAGREYLFLVDAQALTIAPGNSTVSFTAKPSATVLETSDTFNLADIGGLSSSTERKDSVSWWSCLAVPGADTEIEISASSNVYPIWHAWPNLLENGVLSDDSSGDPPTGWSKSGTFTAAYSGGWFEMTSAGADVSISQTIPTTAGEYLFIARVRGDVGIAVGNILNGTDGARLALTNQAQAGRTDVLGTSDHLLMCRFKGNTGQFVSIGKLGTPSSTIGVRWAAVVKVDEAPKLYALGPPTWTSRYWPLEQKIFNAAPSAGGVEGWICTTAGKPGTWKTFGAIAA